jgi:hypothetical protein
MHADPPISFGHRRQQRGHPQLALLPQNMQSHRAVFASTPAKQHRFSFSHHFSLDFFVTS